MIMDITWILASLISILWLLGITLWWLTFIVNLSAFRITYKKWSWACDSEAFSRQDRMWEAPSMWAGALALNQMRREENFQKRCIRLSLLSGLWCEQASFFCTTQVQAAPTIMSSQTGSSSSKEYLTFPLSILFCKVLCHSHEKCY